MPMANFKAAKLTGGKQSALPENVRVFIARKPDGISCSCPEYLGCIQLGSVSQSRGAPTEIRVYNPSVGKYEVVRTWAGNLDRGSVEIQTVLDLEDDTMLDWLQNPCPADLYLVYGNCRGVTFFDEGSYYWILENAYPTDYSTDGNLSPDLFDEDDPKRLIREVLSTSFESQRRYYLSQLQPEDIVIQDTAQQVLFGSAAYCPGGGCGNRANPDPCGELFVLDFDSEGCQSIIHTTRCLCSGGYVVYEADAVITHIANAPRGLVLAVTNSDINDGIIGATYWQYLKYSGICDGDCLNPGILVLDVEATALETYGSSAFIGGNGGYLSWFDLTTREVVKISEGDVFTDDVTAIGIATKKSAWVGGPAAFIAYVTSSGLVVDRQAELSAYIGASDVTAIVGLDSKQAIVGTSLGELWRTEDGGLTWERVCETCDAALTGIVEIEQVSNQVYYVLGQTDEGPELLVTYDSFCHCTRTGLTDDMITAVSISTCYNSPNVLAVSGLTGSGQRVLASV